MITNSKNIDKDAVLKKIRTSRKPSKGFYYLIYSRLSKNVFEFKLSVLYQAFFK